MSTILFLSPDENLLDQAVKELLKVAHTKANSIHEIDSEHVLQTSSPLLLPLATKYYSCDLNILCMRYEHTEGEGELDVPEGDFPVEGCVFVFPGTLRTEDVDMYLEKTLSTLPPSVDVTLCLSSSEKPPSSLEDSLHQLCVSHCIELIRIPPFAEEGKEEEVSRGESAGRIVEEEDEQFRQHRERKGFDRCLEALESNMWQAIHTQANPSASFNSFNSSSVLDTGNMEGYTAFQDGGNDEDDEDVLTSEQGEGEEEMEALMEMLTSMRSALGGGVGQDGNRLNHLTDEERRKQAEDFMMMTMQLLGLEGMADDSDDEVSNQNQQG
jgi:hypothetical protein